MSTPHAAGASGTAARKEADRVAASWPLTGRSEELAFVWDNLAGAPLDQLSHDGQLPDGQPPDKQVRPRAAAVGPAPVRQYWGGTVLSGASGVGKTRLARELSARATACGWHTEWVAATEAAQPIAFGAVARLAPPVVESRPPTTMEMLARFGNALVDRADGAKLLLVIDDAQLLDGATAALVHQLCTSAVARVLLTLRRGEIAPDAISALWKDGIISRLELQPLSSAQVDELLTRVLGGVVDGPTRQRLWRACSGNVFALREMVLTGIESGHLAPSDDVWHWDGEVIIGASAAELVAARLSGLTPAEREGLEIVALGAPLDLDAAVISGREAALASLERQGLIVNQQQSERWEIRLAHPLYGEGVRASMPVMAARSARRALADMLQAAGLPGRTDALRVAVWRLEGDAPPSTDLLITAARQARGLADHPLCERLAARACADGGGFDAHLLLAGALSAQSKWDLAEQMCLRPPLADPARPADRCRVALVLGEVLFWGFGRLQDAADLLAGAANGAAGEEGAECWALLGALAMFSGDLDRAIDAAESALSTPGVSGRVVARALLAAVPSLTLKGATGMAIEQAERGQVIFAAGIDTPAPWRAELAVAHTTALRAAGRFSDAVAAAGHHYERARSGQDHTSAALAALAFGQANLDIGDAMQAGMLLREAAALLRRFDQIGALPWCLAHLVQAAVLTGDLIRARQEMDALEEMAPRTASIFASEIGRARVWSAVGDGELSAARQRARAGAATAARLGHSVVEAVLWLDLARIGDAASAAPELARIAAAADSALLVVAAAHAAALAGDDGLALDRVSAEYVGMGCRLLAAESATAATAAHVAAGHHGLGLTSGRVAERLRADCPGVRTPALNQAAMPTVLTSREAEITGLARRGLANTEIAQRLHLSVRTVEGHLQQVYLKLDVHHRKELPDL